MYIFDEVNVCQYFYKGNVKWYLCVSMIYDLVFMNNDIGSYGEWKWLLWILIFMVKLWKIVNMDVYYK